MNLPTDKVKSLGRYKMFRCWKGSSIDAVLVGLISFISLFGRAGTHANSIHTLFLGVETHSYISFMFSFVV